MTAADLLYPSVPLWAWVALVGAIALLAGLCLLLVKGGEAIDAASADCLLPTDDDAERPFYDITEGNWRVVATPMGERNPDALIEFFFNGEPFRTVTYPAYRVWNIPAHMREITEAFGPSVGGDS